MGTPRVYNSYHTMKSLLLLALVGHASAAVTCDECGEAAQGLISRLTSEASIAEQTDILIATVCPMAPDAAACEAMLTQWWGDMANCLYPACLGAPGIMLQEDCPGAG